MTLLKLCFKWRDLTKSPYKVQFLKDEGNECSKNRDFANASANYLFGVKLLYFSCITSDADATRFKHSTISLNLDLTASKLKQEKFQSAHYALWFLILNLTI